MHAFGYPEAKALAQLADAKAFSYPLEKAGLFKIFKQPSFLWRAAFGGQLLYKEAYTKAAFFNPAVRMRIFKKK